MATLIAWLVTMLATVLIGVALHSYWIRIAQPRLHRANLASKHGNEIPSLAWGLTHGLILVVGAVTELLLLIILIASI